MRSSVSLCQVYLKLTLSVSFLNVVNTTVISKSLQLHTRLSPTKFRLSLKALIFTGTGKEPAFIPRSKETLFATGLIQLS